MPSRRRDPGVDLRPWDASPGLPPGRRREAPERGRSPVGGRPSPRLRCVPASRPQTCPCRDRRPPTALPPSQLPAACRLPHSPCRTAPAGRRDTARPHRGRPDPARRSTRPRLTFAARPVLPSPRRSRRGLRGCQRSPVVTGVRTTDATTDAERAALRTEHTTPVAALATDATPVAPGRHHPAAGPWRPPPPDSRRHRRSTSPAVDVTRQLTSPGSRRPPTTGVTEVVGVTPSRPPAVSSRSPP